MPCTLNKFYTLDTYDMFDTPYVLQIHSIVHLFTQLIKYTWYA